MTETFRTIPITRRTRDLLARIDSYAELAAPIPSHIRWEIRELVDQWDDAVDSEVVVEEALAEVRHLPGCGEGFCVDGCPAWPYIKAAINAHQRRQPISPTPRILPATTGRTS
jgi:hypothetical protein